MNQMFNINVGSRAQAAKGELIFGDKPCWSAWGVRPNGKSRWLWILLVALMCVGLVWQLWIWNELNQHNLDLQRQMQAFKQQSQAKLHTAQAKTPDNATMPGQAVQRQQLQTLLAQLNTPWQQLLEQLEDATPDQVALISMEPDTQRGSIKILAEAKQIDTLLRYAASLQNQGVFGSLTYGKHETNEHDPLRPARLGIELQLRPLSPLGVKNSGASMQ